MRIGDLAGFRRRRREQLFPDSRAFADLREHGAELQLHFAVFGRDGRAAAVEDFQQRFVRFAVGLFPQLLELRRREEPLGDLRRGCASPPAAAVASGLRRGGSAASSSAATSALATSWLAR
ncbi:MAG: hypothetical protein U0R26_11385 [Solirubrobacterales bacterium]